MKFKCLDFLTLEDRTDRLVRNYHSTLPNISSTSRCKPKVTQVELVEIKYLLVCRYVVYLVSDTWTWTHSDSVRERGAEDDIWT